MSIKVFVIDHHPIVRNYLSRALGSVGILCCGEAGNIAESLPLLANCEADFVVVDRYRDDVTGGFIVDILKSVSVDSRVIVFSSEVAIPVIGAAYRSGIYSYISKQCDPDIVIAAIKSRDGPLYFPDGVSERLCEYYLSIKSVDPLLVLSAREFSIFMEVARGLSIDDIATKLNKSKGGIANILVSIRRKIGVRTLNGFVARAFEFGLVSMS